MKHLLPLLAVLLLSVNPASGQARLLDGDPAAACALGKQLRAMEARATRASANFDATYYHLTLDLSVNPNYLEGTTRIEGRAVDEPMTTLALDLDTNMTVQAVRLPDGAALDFTHTDDVLRINLPADVPVGEAVAVDVTYAGVPASVDGTFTFGLLGRNEPIIWTLSEPYGARAWWPCKDHPSDKADSVRVTVTVPDPLRVGSNGLLLSETSQDGRTTYDWRSRYPIATYLVSIAAGDYIVDEQTYTRPDTLADDYGAASFPVLHYAYAPGVPEGWRRVVDVLPVMESWFGPYPFADEKYGHAQFTFGGGMEHQTMSSMGGASIGLVVHEVAHQWFGDLITMATWPHLWLNEGFATYAELLYYLEAQPSSVDAAFTSFLSRARNANGTLIVQDTLDVDNLFNNTRVYAKGGLVLHMLRHVLGDVSFRNVLRTYTADPALRYGTATTADFQRIAEEVSGQNLDTFFRQWVTEGTGYPVYEFDWTYDQSSTGYTVTVEIAQTQGLPLSNVEVFEMPVPLRIETEAGSELVRVQNDERTQRFTFEVAAPPTEVIFDPERTLLRNEPVVTTPVNEMPGVPGAARLDAIYPNPTDDAVHVRFALDASTPVRLTLIDVLGREVAVLHDATQAAGTHMLRQELPDLPGGVYFLRLTTPTQHVTRPIVVQ